MCIYIYRERGRERERERERETHMYINNILLIYNGPSSACRGSGPPDPWSSSP